MGSDPLRVYRRAPSTITLKANDDLGSNHATCSAVGVFRRGSILALCKACSRFVGRRSTRPIGLSRVGQITDLHVFPQYLKASAKPKVVLPDSIKFDGRCSRSHFADASDSTGVMSLNKIFINTYTCLFVASLHLFDSIIDVHVVGAQIISTSEKYLHYTDILESGRSIEG